KFIASSDSVQRCPWDDTNGLGDTWIIYHNLQKNSPAFITKLHPHLIGEHYFFEGRKTMYRAEPEILIPALGLVR
ncbi:MAG: hypothetical protein Q7K45_05905, partial [Nanoarchaeota archaeon]|nr:hypothetical protein [Nanoarchaeota archaeon]